MKRLVLIFLLLAGPALAVNPSEMLSDPVLEARARALDDQIRCVKCQSEAVSSSNADWAHDARLMIRELVAAGKTDDEVLEWFHARYGDFVLMSPPRRGTTLLLWYAGPILLLVMLGLGWRTIRMRNMRSATQDLSPEEAARLSEILDKTS